MTTLDELVHLVAEVAPPSVIGAHLATSLDDQAEARWHSNRLCSTRWRALSTRDLYTMLGWTRPTTRRVLIRLIEAQRVEAVRESKRSPTQRYRLVISEWASACRGFVSSTARRLHRPKDLGGGECGSSEDRGRLWINGGGASTVEPTGDVGRRILQVLAQV